MPGPQKAISIVSNFLILSVALALSTQAVENDKGIGISLQKAPPKMLGLKNPYAAGSEEAGKAGLKLFKRHCASCHERSEAAVNSAPLLNTLAIHSTPAGYLFWYLKNGNLRRGMPAWSSLPDERLWQLVTYLQDVSLNVGIASK